MVTDMAISFIALYFIFRFWREKKIVINIIVMQANDDAKIAHLPLLNLPSKADDLLSSKLSK